MRDKDKDKKKPGYKLQVRRAMANPTKTKQKAPKLQMGQKMMIRALNTLGVKPEAAARVMQMVGKRNDQRF